MPAEIAKPKMSEGRRSSKPLMEKRRRARINNSLGQLKSLILEATNKDTSRHSKLEKADILEMTVRYLRNMQRHQITGSGNTDPATLNRYRHGYSECINEVSRYLDSSEAAVQLRNQLIGHLANCVPVVSQQQTVAYTPAPTPAPVVATAAMGPGSATQPAQAIQVQIAPSPVNNSLPAKVEIPPPARVVSGIPVGQISTGEITVVLPPQAIQGGQFPSHFIPIYAQSAPSLVSPASSTSSQCLPSPTPSTETPTSPVPTHRVSYQYQQPNQDFSSPTPMEQQQTLPQIVSYPLASTASSSSLFASSVASATVYSTAVQPSALVTLPTNVLTPPAEHTHHAVFSQQQHKVPEQHHAFYQSPSKNDLRTVNISVQQQYAAADENVWRPW